MAEKFKIDLLNIDKKLRVGQELKLKFENTIEQKQTFELIWEEPDKFYDKKPIKVILESKKADKKPSEYSQEISIPISAKNKYSGGTIIVRKRGNNPKELFSTELYPDVGESELKEVYW